MPYANPIEDKICRSEQKARRKRKKNLKPCGTPAAYERHRRNDEPIDDLCRRAHNDRCRRYQQARRARGDGFLVARTARNIALERMAVAYPDTYL